MHLNVPFREPLLPDGPLEGAIGGPPPAGAQPATAAIAGRRTLDDAGLGDLAGRLAVARRGLIVAGPDDDPSLPGALTALADATGFPIVADPMSGLRTGGHDRSNVVVRGDQLVRRGPWIDTHRPELVVRTGRCPRPSPSPSSSRPGGRSSS